MDFRVFVEPQQGASYEAQLAVAQEAEKLGVFSAFFRSDHYLRMGGGSGLPGPTDSWVTLAGIARETSTIRLGTLVTSSTFRYPGPLAIAVAQVDAMSHGRVELGLGAGWFAAEHEAYAIPFPDIKQRFDRLEEQLAVITGMWATPAGETFDFDGSEYQVKDSPGLPKPVQTTGFAGGVPIVIGGSGKKRTPELTVRYADEFNAAFDDITTTQELIRRVGNTAEVFGRDAESITYSAAQVLCVGKDEAEFVRRAAAIGREPAELRENGLAGTVDEVAAKVHHFAEIGVTRLYLQTLDLTDLDHLRLVATEVIPQVG